ncbi:MAG: hypothetical protein ACN2B6_04595 [Rickettsiales bacterium]
MIVIDDKHWKIDKRIPIAVIVTLIMQAVAALIWATELDARVGYIETQRSKFLDTNERFVRMEERLDHIKENVDSTKRQIDQLTRHLLGK